MSLRKNLVLAMGAWLAMVGACWADSWSTQLVTQQPPGDAANAYSNQAYLNANGRYLLFVSAASNLTTAQIDTNNSLDVFLYDRVDQSTTLVSHAGGQVNQAANGMSLPMAISADGEWVLFASYATNLANITKANGSNADLFLYERATGGITLVSHNASSLSTTGNSYSQSIQGRGISADGRYILFETASTDLGSAADSNNALDVYLHERTTGSNTLISSAGNAAQTALGQSQGLGVSADGSWLLVQTTASDFAPGITDTNGGYDFYLVERASGARTLISRNSASATTTGDIAVPGGNAYLSNDGNAVAYATSSANVIGGITDGNGGSDAFLYNRSSGLTSLLSRSGSSATVTANGATSPVMFSPSGNFVALTSQATNLVTGVTDANATSDIFLFSRAAGTNALVSRSASSATTTASAASAAFTVSNDGEKVLFRTASNAVVSGVTDTNGVFDTFVWTRATNTSALVSHRLGSSTVTGRLVSHPNAMSSDGQFVVFNSESTDLISGSDYNVGADVFLWSASDNSNALISRAAKLAAATTTGQLTPVALSEPSGRWVLHDSRADNAMEGLIRTTANSYAAFLRDTVNESTVLASRRQGGSNTTPTNNANAKSLTPDGAYVLFTSGGNDVLLGASDTNNSEDVFVMAVATGTTRLVSRNATSSSTTGNAASTAAGISADGNYTIFNSSGTNLVTGITDSNGAVDAFLHDRGLNSSILLSKSATAATTGNAVSRAVSVSPDGRWVLLESSATNLVTGITDTNASSDVFLYDQQSGSVELISRTDNAPATGNASSLPMAITPDGRFVLFRTNATNLVTGVTDNNANIDLYLRDRQEGTTILVSRNASGTATGNNPPAQAYMSDNGQVIAYASTATNAVSGFTDGNGATDVFVFDRAGDTTTVISRSDTAYAAANGYSQPFALTPDGRWVLFSSVATNLPVDTPNTGSFEDTFVYDRQRDSYSLVSRSLQAATSTNGNSNGVSITADGSRVLLHTSATDVVDAVDTNNQLDIVLAVHHLTVTPALTGPGSMSPSTPVDVVHAQTASFTLNPDPGRTIQVSGCPGTLVGNVFTTDAVTYDCTLSVNFAPPSYQLMYSAGPNGSVFGNTFQTVTQGGSGTAVFASANTGYHFTQWSDGVTSAGRTDSNVQANLSVTAFFAINQYTLTYTAGPGGSITGTTPQTVNQGASGTPVTAVPDVGQHFVSWSDGVLTATRTDANVTSNKSVTANFAPDQYTLTYTAGPNGTLQGQSPQTVNHGGSGSTVTVVPNTGYHFVSWSDGVLTASRTDSNIMAPLSVTASFAVNEYALSYSAGMGGSLTGSTNQTVQHGSAGSTVTAVPDTGYHFVTWSDGVLTAARTESNVTGPSSVVAQFALNSYTLTYTAGLGGSISGDASQPVSHGNDGSTVTAVPDTGYHFVSWSDGLLTASRTDVGVTAPLSVSASFALNEYTLNYTANANGTLLGVAVQTVQHGGGGSAVTAVPNTGYHLVSWSDGVLTAQRTDTNVTSNLSVSASFAINEYSLAYTAGPNGSIQGPAQQTVSHGGSGTTVTAVAQTGYHFVSWSDGVLTAERTDSNVTAPLAVTATFAINEYSLTYTAGPNGTISGSAQQTVQHGSAGSAVTATPNTGYAFVAWSDGVLMATRTDSNVTQTLSVTASFALQTHTLSYTAGQHGFIQGQATQVVAHGSAGTEVTAVPDVGYHFTAWSDGVLTAARTDSNVQADVAVSASFALNSYTISYSAGVGGTIQGATSQTVNHGENAQSVQAVANPGFHFVNWSDGLTTTARTDTNITQAFQRTASFATNEADVSVSLTNNVHGLRPGSAVVYTLTVTNAGPDRAEDVELASTHSAELASLMWACRQGDSIASCPSSLAGSGALLTHATLGAGQVLVFDISGVLAAQASNPVTSTATATPGSLFHDPVLSNNAATDSDAILPDSVFRNGFEGQ